MSDQQPKVAKFPHLRPDEAKLLGMALQVARLHYSPTMPNTSPELWKRINRLYVRLKPWIEQRSGAAEVADGD